jgi:hypothetical protein
MTSRITVEFTEEAVAILLVERQCLEIESIEMCIGAAALSCLFLCLCLIQDFRSEPVASQAFREPQTRNEKPTPMSKTSQPSLKDTLLVTHKYCQRLPSGGTRLSGIVLN